MILVRFVGWLLLLAALVVLGRDGLVWYDTHVFAPVSLEELWSNFDRSSLDRFEATVVRTVAPWVWTGFIHVVLRFWAALTFAVLAFLLIWAAHPGDDRRRRRR
jgi:hypothetical protein